MKFGVNFTPLEIISFSALSLCHAPRMKHVDCSFDQPSDAACVSVSMDVSHRFTDFY
jgi:hypothetical protein